MDKKLILIFVCMIFLVGTVSAFEFDNTIDYEENDLKVIITNAFGLGKELGTATLKSHSSVDEVLSFGFGKEEVVMYYDFNSWELYKDGLGEVYFTDKITGKEIEKEFYFVEWVSENVTVNDYKEVCNSLGNGTEVCNQEISGTHLKEKWSWERLENKDIPNRNTRIGLKTYVGEGDYIDAVWTIAGKKVIRHAEWLGNLNVRLQAFWKLNESSGELRDSLNEINMTAVSTPLYSETGIIGTAIGYDATTDYFTNSTPADTKRISFDTELDFSWNLWVNSIDNDADAGSIFVTNDDHAGGESPDQPFYRANLHNGGILVSVGTTSLTVSNISDGTYHMITFVRNDSGNGCYVYVDNVLDVFDATCSQGNAFASVLSFGELRGSSFSDHDLDEFGIWNRTLSVAEISQLYNGGSGITFELGFSIPTITLNNPTDDANLTNPNINFNCSVFGALPLVNVSLILDGVTNETNSSGINNSDYIFPKILNEGFHNWTCQAYNNESRSRTASPFSYNLSFIPPVVTLNNPINNLNSTSSSITFNATVFDDIGLINVSLILDGVTNETNSSGINNSDYIFPKILADGIHNWSVRAVDSFGNITTAPERTLNIDTLNPAVTIIAPVTNVTFLKNNTNLTFEWTATDVNLDSCIYDYEGTNVSVACGDNSTNLTIIDFFNRDLTFYVNDTFGRINVTTINWFYYVWENSQTFNAEALEVSTEEFEINITITNTTVQSARLWYNNTPYTASIVLDTDTAVLSREITIPNVDVDINASFFWEINLDTFQVNTSSLNQTILFLNVDDCGSNNISVMNFTLVDEITQSIMNSSFNSSIEVEVTLYTIDETEVLSYSNTYSSTPYAPVCINLLPNDTSYLIDVVVGYVADTYVQEFWYLDNGILSLNNDSLNNYIIKNITLRDLPVSESTTFLFKYYDEVYAIHEGGVVTLLRKYIGEGVFKEAERCQLDANGECHLHFVEEDVIYQFRITDESVLEFLSGEYNAKCVETPCRITLTKSAVGGVWDDELDALDEGTYVLDIDTDNRTVTLDFNLEETGTMELEIFEYDQDASADVLVVEDTTTAKTGSVDVLIPLSFGNFTYYAVVKHNDEFVSSTWVDMNERGFQYFGNLGLFLGALLVLTLGLIAVSSGGWTIGFLILGLIIVSVTKLVDMDFYVLMWIVSAGALITWKLVTRRSA